jgi:hypothetical protein
MQKLFFFWFGNTGADVVIAIFLPTLKHFSCNGAVDWSTKWNYDTALHSHLET